MATELMHPSQPVKPAAHFPPTRLRVLRSELLGDMLFISSFPATYKEHDRIIAQTIKAGHWEGLGVLADPSPAINRQRASYKPQESQVNIEGINYPIDKMPTLGKSEQVRAGQLQDLNKGPTPRATSCLMTSQLSGASITRYGNQRFLPRNGL